MVIVCALMGKETYYIIPYEHMPKCGAYIPVNNHFLEDDTCFIHEGNKYFKFRETWELLEGENRNKKVFHRLKRMKWSNGTHRNSLTNVNGKGGR